MNVALLMTLLLSPAVDPTALPDHASKSEYIVARAGPVAMGHEGDVRAVAYAPDGTWLATAGDDGFVRGWSLRDGSALWKRPSACRAQCLAFDRDGHLYVNEGDAVAVLDAEGNSLRRLSAGEAAVRTGGPVAVSPDGRVAAGHDGLLLHGDDRTLDAEHVAALAFSRGGEKLAAGTDDGEVFVLLEDRGFGQHPRQFQWKSGRVRDLAFVDDGHLAVIGYDRRLRVFDIGGGPPRRTVDVGHTATGLAVHPDTKRAAVGVANGDVLIIDLGAGQVERRLVGHLPDGVPALAFSPNGAHLATGGGDNSVRVWTVADGTASLPHWRSSGALEALAITDDSFLTGDVKGRVLRWRLADGAFLGQVGQIERRGQRAPVTDLVATDEGIIAVDADGGPELLLGRGRPVSEADGGSEALLVHEDHVASACDARAGLCVRRLDTGEAVGRAERAAGEVLDLALDPSRRLLASASADGAVDLWGWPGLSGPRTVTRYEEKARAVSFRRGVLASAGDDQIRLHDARTTSQRARLEPDCGEILDIAFAPDSDRLAFACADGRVGLWDVRGPSQALWLDGHDGAVTRVAFTRDGRRLVSTSRDLTALVWRVPGTKAPSS